MVFPALSATTDWGVDDTTTGDALEEAGGAMAKLLLKKGLATEERRRTTFRWMPLTKRCVGLKRWD